MDSVYEVLYNSASIITVPLIDADSVAFTPTTASYTIFNPGGDVLQASTAATISGSFLRLNWPGNASVYQENFRIDMTFNDGTTQYNRSIYFDAVVMLMAQLLTDDELYDEYPALSTDKWTGETDWRRQKRAAWRDIRAEISSRGFRPALCSPSSIAFVMPHKHLTLAKIFKTMFESVGDEFHEKWRYHDEQYRLAMANVLGSLKYDAGEVKVISPHAEININSFKVRRGG